MALSITPGTLRAEGPGFVPDTHYKEFVQTTDIEGFAPENFDRDANTAIHFIASSTDPPASNSRSRSMFWFKRGEGRLYTWDSAWNNCDVTNPIGYWLAASDRKDILVRWFDGEAPGTDFWHLAPYGPVAIQGHACSASNVAQHGGMRRFVPNGHRTQTRWYKNVISGTDVSQAPEDVLMLPCTEIGYCWAGMHSNVSGPGFAWVIGSEASSRSQILISSKSPRSPSSDVAYWPYKGSAAAYMIGFITSSGPASAYSAAHTVARMQMFLKSEASRSHIS